MRKTDDDLIKSVVSLINLRKGDIGRLNYILDTLRSGKSLFSSDQKYLDSLQTLESIPKQTQESNESSEEDVAVEKLKDEVKHLNEKLEKIHDEQSVDQVIKSNEKSETTTLILAIVLGLIGLQGVGHMYVDKVGKGVGILISSLILFGGGLTATSTVAFGVGIFLFLIYFIMFIWQIFDAQKSCRKYNLNVYKSYSTKYSQHKIQETSHHEHPNNEIKQNSQKNTKNRFWSKKKIIATVAVSFLVISVVVITSFSNIPELIELSQQREGSGNSLIEYSQNYDKWSECVKNNGRLYCGDPPQPPFDSEPIDCSTGSNDFRCNPYYTETHSGLIEIP